MIYKEGTRTAWSRFIRRERGYLVNTKLFSVYIPII